MRLNERIERHLARGLVLAGGLAAGSQASAAIVHSGVVNIPIPLNIDGVYLNVVTGATDRVAGSNRAVEAHPLPTVAVDAEPLAVLDHHDRIGAGGDGCTRHDADRLAGAEPSR